jgi:hypothetical protein
LSLGVSQVLWIPVGQPRRPKLDDPITLVNPRRSPLGKPIHVSMNTVLPITA